MSADTLDRILLRAEARLKEQEAFAKKISLQSSSTSGKTDVATRVRPNLPAPYMDSTKRVVRVDGKDLVSKEMRDLANRPKVVEDPVSIQRKKIKDKRKLCRDFLAFDMMKISQFTFLEADHCPVLGTTRNHEGT